MTVLNRYGENVRGFQVIVARPEKKTNLRYPIIDGQRALQLMEIMAQRGRETIAETSSDYCEETLTIDEMREIFASQCAIPIHSMIPT